MTSLSAFQYYCSYGLAIINAAMMGFKAKVCRAITSSMLLLLLILLLLLLMMMDPPPPSSYSTNGETQLVAAT
jgi:hypothetical protein